MRQRVRYVATSDGVNLAWAESGAGPVLVKPSNWLTHLEYDLESPVWRHWIGFLSQHFRLVRYDERGCGMTDHDVADVSAPRWTDDLEAVVDAADIQTPFTLLGISQGSMTAVAYAARHPERVARLILYGGYARGWARRGQPETERVQRAMLELLRHGWASDNPAFRAVFTSRFVPGATDEQARWFNDLCRRTTDAVNAVRLLEARAVGDVTALLPRVRAPTLVLHARDDGVVPLAEGRLLAAGIPHASFVMLETPNHILLEHEPAWVEFQRHVLEFAGTTETTFGPLSPREQEVLRAIGDGLTNAQVAARLGISEKTVRNHLSKLFEKLGVHSRAQAIVWLHRRDKFPIPS